VFDWPLNVGGKPDNSTLAFVPIAFELTILAGGLATAAAFVLRAGLFPGARREARGPARDERQVRHRASLEGDGVRHRRSAAPAARQRRGSRSGRWMWICDRPPAWMALVLGAAAASACGPAPEKRGFEYTPDMAYSLAYDSFSPNPVTRDGLTLQRPVRGTIPRGFLPLHYVATAEDAERAGRRLQNPVPPSARAASKDRCCSRRSAWCATATRRRRRPVDSADSQPAIVYVRAGARRLPAGRIFHVITFGSGRMRSYASQLAPRERWLIAAHVQTLQREGASHDRARRFVLATAPRNVAPRIVLAGAVARGGRRGRDRSGPGPRCW
jgi:hypothetical protein